MKATKRAREGALLFLFVDIRPSRWYDPPRYSARGESMDYSAKELREKLPDVPSKERADSLVKNYHTSNGVR